MIKLDSLDTSEILVTKSSNLVRLVRLVSGDKSEFERSFPARSRSFRLVKLDRGDRFEIVVLISVRDLKLVKLDRGEKSDMSLPERFRLIRLVKFERGDTSEIALLSRRSVIPDEPHEDLRPPRFRSVRFVKLDSGEMSERLLLARSRFVRFVKPEITETSVERLDMPLLSRSSLVRLVKLDKAEKFEIALLLTCPLPDTHSLPKSSVCRLVANSSPVKSLIFAFRASRRVNINISDLVIVAPLALFRLASIAARRFASGMLTGVGS